VAEREQGSTGLASARGLELNGRKDKERTELEEICFGIGVSSLPKPIFLGKVSGVLME
jgi:hypothetical protein